MEVVAELVRDEGTGRKMKRGGTFVDGGRSILARGKRNSSSRKGGGEVFRNYASRCRHSKKRKKTEGCISENISRRITVEIPYALQRWKKKGRISS